MANRTLALNLVLDALGLSPSDQDAPGHDETQKAVYLAQALTDVDLGYRFEWHPDGPYSPALARDYFALSSSLRTGEGPPEGRSLRQPFASQLASVRDRLTPPADLNTSFKEWLAVLASYHFLTRVTALEAQRSGDIIRRSKAITEDQLSAVSNALSLAAGTV